MRRRRFIILSFLYFYIAAMLMAACETESYETGQGEYSLLQADLCELTVNSQKLDASYTLALNAISNEDYEKAREYLNICFVYFVPK